MRLGMAWILGILAAGSVGAIFDAFASEGGFRLFETTIAGANANMAAVLLSVMCGAWIGFSVFKGSFHRDASDSDRIFSEAIVVFAIIQGIGGIAVMVTFAPKPGLYALAVNAIHLVVVLCAFVVARKYYKRHESGFRKERA